MPNRNPEQNKQNCKNWYKKHKILAYSRISKRRKAIREWFQSQKVGLSCATCPENHPAALDFHHKNRKTKDFNMSQAASNGYGRSRILKEIEKCIVLCSNCHRKLEYNLR